MDEPIADTLKPSTLARAIGVSTPYACQILKGTRVPPLETAIRIFNATGRKFGPLVDATDKEAKAVAKFGAAQ